MHNECEPSVVDPAKDHQLESRSERADGAIVTHNTLSAEVTHVQVFYPFHPLRGYSLRVLRKPKKGVGAVVVMDGVGKRLKIPVWMLSPEAARAEIARGAYLNSDSLLSLAL